MPTRRDLLRAGGAVATLAATGCADLTRGRSQPPLPIDWARPEKAGPPTRFGDIALRTLNRAGYGPRPGDVDRVREIGVDAYLEEQLAPERLAESPAVGWRLWPLDTLQVDTDFRFAFPKEQVQAELQQAAVVRATYSRCQLQELMVEFWSDHFNVSQLKGDSAFMKTTDDDAVIRRHALGRFRDLLFASAKSPAMLYYLDNFRNTGAALNENYARELMELHTLGVDGGYRQRDVQEVARCFTGWSIHDEATWWNGSFVYRPDTHDDGPRHVLGHALPAGLGERHGERILEILADHPATAYFIARKLCRRFVADDPRSIAALAERLAGVFRRTGGDIRQVLSVLLRSEEFRHGGTPKLKRPFDYVISALRALNADTDGSGVLSYLHPMGQPPFQWAMPNGYPDRSEAWLTSLLARWNFALALAAGQVAGTSLDLPGLMRAAARGPIAEVHALQLALFGRRHPELDAPALAIRQSSPGSTGFAQVAALLLTSPAFQWR